MMWSLALRNLVRDRRRTVTSTVAVGAALLAALLFLAYVRFIEASLANVVIYSDTNAHVQVYRKDGPQNLAADPARFSLSAADQAQVASSAAGLEGYRRSSPQMMGVGVLQHGARSTVFLARGVELDFDRALQASAGPAAPGTSSAALGADGIALTAQIKDILAAADGAEVQLLGASYQRRMNAVDATVRGQFSTGIEATEDKGLKAPLALMQSLYDTDSASRVVIELGERGAAAGFRDALAARLDAARPGWFEVTTWDHPQVGQLYTSFMGFFKLVFIFTGAVVFLISLTTIQHTIAMNVSDRVREIGMLRALGFSRSAITGLFVRESILGAVLAAAVALAGCYLVIVLLAGLGVQTALPRIAGLVPLALSLPLAWALVLLALALAGIGAGAWLSARKRVGGRVRAGGRGVSLVQLLGAMACLLLFAGPAPVQAAEAATPAAPMTAPTAATMTGWLRQADMARGGYGSYQWTLRIHTEDPAGPSDTTYDVTVKASRALARTVEPKRYQGEKVLIATRAMWYLKPGLRKPVSVSPQQRLVGEAANGDIAAVQYARDYAPAWIGVASVNGAECYQLKLAAADDGATYETIIYYVDRKTLLGVKAEFMTSSGTVFKSAVFDYRNRISIEGKDMPFISSMKIVNASFPDRFSRLDYSAVQKTHAPDSMFALDNLMTM